MLRFAEANIWHCSVTRDFKGNLTCFAHIKGVQKCIVFISVGINNTGLPHMALAGDSGGCHWGWKLYMVLRMAISIKVRFPRLSSQTSSVDMHRLRQSVQKQCFSEGRNHRGGSCRHNIFYTAIIAKDNRQAYRTKCSKLH